MTPHEFRFNSGTPTSLSSSRIVFVMAGWVRQSARAACVEDQGSRERCSPCARAITQPKPFGFYVDFVRKYCLRQLQKANVKAMDAQHPCDYVELAKIAVASQSVRNVAQERSFVSKSYSRMNDDREKATLA
ncbi:hypothetical protein [Cupriavidus necator]|uniref:hypothetical protein n=1 Tax=Cupriavidus necator TaxID=106590 RepID=UPI003F741A71